MDDDPDIGTDDWGDVSDDFGPEDWESHLGGPDDDAFPEEDDYFPE